MQFPYPDNVFNDLKIVIADLAFVYTMANSGSGTSPPKVLRTKSTPYSAASFKRRHVSKVDSCFPLHSNITTTQAEPIDPYEHWQPISPDSVEIQGFRRILVVSMYDMHG